MTFYTDLLSFPQLSRTFKWQHPYLDKKKKKIHKHNSIKLVKCPWIFEQRTKDLATSVMITRYLRVHIAINTGTTDIAGRNNQNSRLISFLYFAWSISYIHVIFWKITFSGIFFFNKSEIVNSKWAVLRGIQMSYDCLCHWIVVWNQIWFLFFCFFNSSLRAWNLISQNYERN